MISYEPPKQEAFGVGDYIDGLGTVLDPDDEEMVAFMEGAGTKDDTVGVEDGYLMQINQLRDENTKLRDDVERLRSVVSDGVDNAREILAENVKLLRLLRALALCADDNADCDNCVMNGAAYSSVRQTFCDGMADELRAVGIEVD